jgi:hypothetical protein
MWDGWLDSWFGLGLVVWLLVENEWGRRGQSFCPWRPRCCPVLRLGVSCGRAGFQGKSMIARARGGTMGEDGWGDGIAPATPSLPQGRLRGRGGWFSPTTGARGHWCDTAATIPNDEVQFIALTRRRRWGAGSGALELASLARPFAQWRRAVIWPFISRASGTVQEIASTTYCSFGSSPSA